MTEIEDEELIMEELLMGLCLILRMWSCVGRLRAIKPAHIWVLPPAYPMDLRRSNGSEQYAWPQKIIVPFTIVVKK